MSELGPIAVSVTWGAGGSTRERSLDLAEIAQTEYGIDTLLHLTCTNMEQGLVDGALRKAKELGIENILALRGDPPRGEEYWIPTDPRFTHAIDLVKYIKSSPEFSSSFCVGVAAYSDGHDTDVDEDTELNCLKAKVDAGAEFIITQLFLRWITVPVIPGIMPLQSYASFLRLTKLCGTKVPPELHLQLEPLRHDDQKMKDFGVTLAADMIKRLIDDGDVKGVHFCTLNLERSVRKVLENLDWAGGSPRTSNKLIIDSADTNARESAPNDLTIRPADANQTATDKLATKPLPEIQAQGKGEINNASTWDEFPNGRFASEMVWEFRSVDETQYLANKERQLNDKGNLKRTEAISRWGSPKSVTDLTELFLSHLHSVITSTPFSPSPLSPESLLILSHLERLTRRGWWTVFSQPAVDGVDSADEVFGWGPANGYVFQKGFVEFFAEKEDVDRLEEKIRSKGDGWVDFFAANEKVGRVDG
ncbi:hypothetical protein EW145_g283 [Phellinidium pouzarii]|uniref:MTHFR SAM-binding regulatory domain-containing protein n=1 Tax=Phellinidium pouzarii TaxID=167371 RepID=A0A4S4LJ72_9AGAM|nr:hypothetical protein EW145_g283 [Phellinidium pouzarii]